MSLSAAWVRSHLAALGCEDAASFSSGCCRKSLGSNQLLSAVLIHPRVCGGCCDVVLSCCFPSMGFLLCSGLGGSWGLCFRRRSSLAGSAGALSPGTSQQGGVEHGIANCRVRMPDPLPNNPFPSGAGWDGDTTLLCLCVLWRQDLPWHGGGDPETGSGGQNVPLITPGFGAPSL